MGIVVGIGGVSRAGKTLLSKKILEWYSEKSVSILYMDDFVFPKDQIPRIKDEIDWEVPESVDYTKLAAAIAENRLSNDIVIVDGILIFNDHKILALYDRKIFVKIDYDTFRSRKLNDKRWKIPDWYIEHIWTSYIVHGMTNSEGALTVSGTEYFDRELILEFIGLD